MVDPRDIQALEQTGLNTLSEEVRSWAIYQKIPSGTRQATVRALYERYHMHEKPFVQMMLRSKTGLGDEERLVHERMIKHYLQLGEVVLGYEVECGGIGSVDFRLETWEPELPESSIIEVKNIASWKQVLVLLLYHKYHPECEMVAAFFGKRPPQSKQDIIRVALNELSIHCYWVLDDGRLERFSGNDIPDEF